MLAQEIGKALRAARQRVGISLEQLAETTALDASLLSSLERGERMISTAKLDRLASTLGIDAFALYGGRDVERGLVILPRQATHADFRHDDLPLLRRALERATALRELSAILRPDGLAMQFDPVAPSSVPAQQGYDLARRVRVALGRITEPLANLPQLLAEQFDVPVISEALATKSLWAAAIRSPASRAVAIVLNTSAQENVGTAALQARLVNRVSICHELCHALFDEPKNVGVDVILDDPPREGQDRSPVEQRAGAFAAEMLIPSLGLKELFGDGNEASTDTQADQLVDQVRAHFGTPGEIAVNHLYNHGYVARVADFREHLIARVKERSQNQGRGTSPFVNDEEAWRRVLIDRTRHVHDADMITDGAARAVLEIAAGDPLPWERAEQ